MRRGVRSYVIFHGVCSSFRDGKGKIIVSGSYVIPLYQNLEVHHVRHLQHNTYGQLYENRRVMHPIPFFFIPVPLCDVSRLHLFNFRVKFFDGHNESVTMKISISRK